MPDIIERLATCSRQLLDAGAEIERLRAAIRDAHGLIDNDLVVPWIMAHKLDDILNEQKE